MRIVRIGADSWINLDYLILAEPIAPPPGGDPSPVFRVIVAPGIIRELSPDDAAMLRRHLAALDEPALSGWHEAGVVGGRSIIPEPPGGGAARAGPRPLASAG